MSDKPEPLRGNPFISTHMVIDNPKDMAFGEAPFPRKCSWCFFREGGDPEECNMVGYKAKKDFGVPIEEKMPTEIDGHDVGYYCRRWVHPDSD
ncbi:MAG: hypothetical protein ABIH87_01590 [bacterium]